MTISGPINTLVRPKYWDDYVGQDLLKNHLQVKIQAASKQVRMFDHTLLVAPAGAGKTTLARLIAQELGDPFHELEMPLSADDFVWFCEDWHGGCVLLDELHRAPKELQEILHSALHGTIKYKGEEIPCQHITFIGATTTHQQSGILEPLIQRFTYRPPFEPYTDDELAFIIAGMAKRIGLDLASELCRELAPAAVGTPRAAEPLVTAARDLAATGQEVTVAAVLDLAQVDGEGLTPEHLRYLRTLHAVGGRMGAKPLANLLGLSTAAMDSLERPLLLKGFIKLQSNGRKITPEGKEKAGASARLAVDERRARRVSA